jgi:hypothetical protein
MAVTRRSRAATSRKTPPSENSDRPETAEATEAIEAPGENPDENPGETPEAIVSSEPSQPSMPDPEAASSESVNPESVTSELSETATGTETTESIPAADPVLEAVLEPVLESPTVSHPEPVIEASQGVEAMSQSDEVVAINPQPVQEDAAIVSSQKPVSMVWDRPVMPSEIQVTGTIMSAGERPIATSSMEVFGTFFNGRPIASSSLRLADMLPGDRPIFFSDVQMLAGDAGLPGNRPIMISPPGMLAAALLPGNRPIFSNQVDPEPDALMGYLD